MGDALTAEKLAFIRGEKAVPPKAGPVKREASQSERTIELETTAPNEEQAERQQRRRSRGRESRSEEPPASEILNQMLVPVTIRLKHRTAQALKRAALEQKLKHVKPDQVQEIGEEAFTDWLTRSGYLD
jgi:hypothetical protein